MKQRSILQTGRKQKAKQEKPRTISTLQLISCYAASILIVVFSFLERNRCIQQGEEHADFYIILAVLGVLFSAVITWRQIAAKKKQAKTDRKSLQKHDDT